MLDNVRARFPYLVGYIMFFGGPLGICLGTVRRFPTLQQVGAKKFDLSRAAVVGGLTGIVGGWAFGQWMAKVNHFPLICSFSGTFAVMDLVWDGDWVTEFSGGFSDP